ncbi:MAG: haloacid dehalogenase-like hydrolase [Bryobacterales bacterium]|nr:haloacid dehalogenase-like hydrolase [Bryobacterales bacterium]
MSHPSPILVLFDIDGTLIRNSGPQHKQALEHAVSTVFSVKASLEGISTHGMLDTDLVLAMARRARVPQREARITMPSIIQLSEQRYLQHGPETLGRRICPGARALLHRLHRRDIPLLLVTGNFPLIGWRKLELAGLKHFFLDGAFAGMSTSRAGLARLAIRTARHKGWAQHRALTSLIGDSPNDIRAAHANGIRSIAVSTGINTSADLQQHSPHLLVERLTHLRLSHFLPPS